MRAARWLESLPLRLRALFRRDELDSELDEELRYHLERLTEIELARGLSPQEARLTARRQLGNLTSHKEQTREGWSWSVLEVVWQDLRFAARSLRQAPGFSLTAILTLTLGIGASTAIFSVVDSVLLKPLAFRESSRLVAVWEKIPFFSPDSMGPNVRHADVFARYSQSISGLARYSQGSAGLGWTAERPASVGVVAATPNIFKLLEVRPMIGAAFDPEHEVQGRDSVILLSHGIWQSLFQADPHILGKKVMLGDRPRTVIGVLPAHLRFPNRNELASYHKNQLQTTAPPPDAFVPLVNDLASKGWQGEFGNQVAIARLRPGVTVTQAQAELNSLLPIITKNMPAASELAKPGALLVHVQPMKDALVSKSAEALWFLLAAVLGLMLIACVNLANAQWARGMARMREAGVRGALGAPRWRLACFVFAENLLLAASGGLGGIFFSLAALRLLRSQTLIQIPRVDEVALHPGVLAFSVTLILGSALVFSVLPMLGFLRQDPRAALHPGGARVHGSRGNERTQSLLVATQIFGCAVLLLLAGVFAKNLWRVLGQERGYSTQNIVLAQVSLPRDTYGTHEKRVAYIDGLLRKLRQLPRVENAAYMSVMPLEGDSWIDGLRRSGGDGKDHPVNLRFVSPGYFETMGHRLIAGRFFEEADRQRKHILLTESLARALWPTGDPIGGATRIAGEEFTIAGVLADASLTTLKEAPARIAFLLHSFNEGDRAVFAVRSSQRPSDLAGPLRQAIWEHEPIVSITRIKSMDTQVRESLGAEHVQTYLISAFAASALLLAMVGIYGVLSYAVTTRRQEIGVRLALGASRRAIYSLTVGGLALPVLIGLGVGIAVSFSATHILRALLAGAEGIGVGLVASVVTLFLISASAASWLPARRAAAVNPMESLRAD
jgi:predicted permease